MRHYLDYSTESTDTFHRHHMVDHSELINITSNPQQHLVEQRTVQRIGFLSRLNYKIQLEVRMQGMIPHASGLMSLIRVG